MACAGLFCFIGADARHRAGWAARWRSTAPASSSPTARSRAGPRAAAFAGRAPAAVRDVGAGRVRGGRRAQRLAQAGGRGGGRGVERGALGARAPGHQWLTPGREALMVSRSGRTARPGSGRPGSRARRAGRSRRRRTRPTRRRTRSRRGATPARGRRRSGVRRARRRRRRGARVDDGRLRAGRARRRSRGRRGAHRHDEAHEVRARPCRRARRSIAISGTTPEPPPTSSAGRVAVPDEPAADRPAHLELVAGDDVVVQERRHLAVRRAARR